MCILSIKVPLRKKSGNLFNDPHIYIYIYIYKLLLAQQKKSKSSKINWFTNYVKF